MSNSQNRTEYDMQLNELYGNLCNEKIDKFRSKNHTHPSYIKKDKDDRNVHPQINEGYRTLAFDVPENPYSYYVKYPDTATINKKPWNSDSIWNKQYNHDTTTRQCNNR